MTALAWVATGRELRGLKYTCVSCAARFYDLCRLPATCPKCAAEQPKPRLRSLAPARLPSARWPTRRPAAAADAAETELPEVLILDDPAEELEEIDEDAEVPEVAEVEADAEG